MTEMDESIDRAEKLVSTLSLGDVNFKLVLTTARLTDNVTALSTTVSSLTATVSALASDIHGGSGVRNELKDVRYDVKDASKKAGEVAEKIEQAMVVLWRLVWFLVLVGAVTVIADIRTFAPLILGGLK